MPPPLRRRREMPSFLETPLLFIFDAPTSRAPRHYFAVAYGDTPPSRPIAPRLMMPLILRDAAADTASPPAVPRRRLLFPASRYAESADAAHARCHAMPPPLSLRFEPCCLPRMPPRYAACRHFTMVDRSPTPPSSRHAELIATFTPRDAATTRSRRHHRAAIHFQHFQSPPTTLQLPYAATPPPLSPPLIGQFIRQHQTCRRHAAATPPPPSPEPDAENASSRFSGRRRC